MRAHGPLLKRKHVGNDRVRSRDEAIGLLAEYGRAADWTRHCFAVADAAARVGCALEGARAIDADLLWSTALLHDIGRCMTHDPIMHGVEGYKLLESLGHEDAAFVCASHVLFGLDAREACRFGLPARDFIPLTYEQRIVPLVDFLTEVTRPTTLERRFSSLRERNVDNGPFLDRLDRAHRAASLFMAQLDDEIGESVEQVVASGAC